MAHFATLDSNNKIINVEVVNNAVITDSNGDEQEQLGIDFLEQIHGGAGVTYKQTSYNENIRKNFAQVGGTYDASKDAFIPVKPFDSWVLNNTTCKWEAPTTYPTDGKSYGWDEDTTSWKENPDPGS
tara:strand:+ start:276 stop:656 length:381 start_codon:yes stop_codon:yes gene_type:complete